MNARKTLLSIGVLAVLVGGGYAAYDYYAGNHIAIQQVIPTNPAAQTPASSSAASVPATANATAATAATATSDAAKLDGLWNIQPASKVYLSVTTSKETVNIEGASVKGTWTINSADPSQMKAEGIVDTTKFQSGNAQRDNHVKAADSLNVAAFPEAKFTVKSFQDFPKEWKEGSKASFKMLGTLTIKGISKDVTFTSDALLSQGALSIEGSTVVTFDDFGMKNPHTVLLDTQNNVTVQLRLVLGK
ncbi:YceI family protein [Paenibacillus agricola]|uniref:YceI family protein n=1 Tax=Paenibacillus agricola TaxID=2716264 RepID=A0ABX0JKU0_9BACL|nr:YceI family protein [Paenibacillus agricola]NHN34560.1 YceI family protein [Paenibacillus agricola]